MLTDDQFTERLGAQLRDETAWFPADLLPQDAMPYTRSRVDRQRRAKCSRLPGGNRRRPSPLQAELEAFLDVGATGQAVERAAQVVGFRKVPAISGAANTSGLPRSTGTRR
jgi:hypothetical protein